MKTSTTCFLTNTVDRHYVQNINTSFIYQNDTVRVSLGLDPNAKPNQASCCTKSQQIQALPQRGWGAGKLQSSTTCQKPQRQETGLSRLPIGLGSVLLPDVVTLKEDRHRFDQTPHARNSNQAFTPRATQHSDTSDGGA